MELLTLRLRLRELEELDAPACNTYERDPDVVRFLPHGSRTLEDSLQHILAVRAEAQETPRHLFDFALTLRDDGSLLGRVGFRVTSAVNREAQLWYVLAPDHQGHGFAVEAAEELLDYGFGGLGLHRFFVAVDPRNVPSRQVAERLGMREEGQLRESVFCKGEWTDQLILAMLDREWEERVRGS